MLITQEIETIQNLTKEYPNDFDLGQNYRKLMSSLNEVKTDELCRLLSNDEELGKYIRMEVNKVNI